MQDSGRIAYLHELFSRGEISPVEVARAQLEAIDEQDRAVNSFCLVDSAKTLEMAEASERRYRAGAPLSKMDGIPTSVKDTVNVAAWPTRRGSRTAPESVQGRDAVSIARLRGAGAVFIGKTTTPEFAWKGVTDSPLFGVTRNPLDLELTAGGSSGGAAAAVALGLGAMGVGTDAAGSVRIPAAFCGVVGYKPTLGRIPLDPYPTGFFSQLAHMGPITATVADAAISASIMGGPSAADWTSFRHSVQDPDLEDDVNALKSVRLGVPVSLPDLPTSAEVGQAWSDFLAVIEPYMNHMRHVDLPFADGRDVTGQLYRLGCGEATSSVPPDRYSELDPELFDFIAPVKALSADSIVGIYRSREEIANRTSHILRTEIDVFISPTMAVTPPRICDIQQPGGSANWLDWNVFTPLFNLCQGPAISVPWSNRNGLPIGIQIAAAPGRDELVLCVAAAIEKLSACRPAPLIFDQKRRLES